MMRNIASVGLTLTRKTGRHLHAFRFGSWECINGRVFDGAGPPLLIVRVVAIRSAN